MQNLTGLTSEDVRAREAAGLTNKPVSAPSKTVGQIIFTNVFTYFNVFFCALAACIAIFGSWYDLAFMGVVVTNTVIGIVQELRSKKKLDRLTILTTPKVRVIRGGQEILIDSSSLVLDDIVIFAAGEQICADAKVLSGACRVNESLVTGEADEINKGEGEALLSGSFVVAGECVAVLTAVGAESFASKLTVEAKRSGRMKKSEMMRSLSRLVAVVGVVSIPFGAALLYKEINWLGRDTGAAVTSTVAALVGMIPEGLYLLTSLALVAGVLRLSKKQTLVHEMACIETLARVDVLCVDKTGTITEEAMDVDEVVAVGGAAISGADIRRRMTDYCSAQAAENETMRALGAYFSGTPQMDAADKLPFTSSRKYGAVTFTDGTTYALGAPEMLLGDEYETYAADVAGYARGGRRVLLFAECRGLQDEKPVGVTPAAFIMLRNKIRPTAPATFRWFAEQGVTIKVISGDNHLTVSEVAGEACIENADRAVDARTLTTDEELADAAENCTVFGRVTPQQKKKLISAMKAAGHTVAMTGDGVNDVLALREADCSVAMASGSAAAGQVANIVLLDSDFTAMPSVVAEGRRVINNIERSASLYLVKNIFAFALALVTLFFSLPFPFAPSQLTLVNMMTIGIPSFVLAMEPNRERVRGRFMTSVLSRAIPAAAADFVLVLAALAVYRLFFPDSAAESTAATLIMGLVGLYNVDRACRPYRGNRIRIALIASMAALFAIGFCLMTALVMRVPLTVADYVILGSAALLTGPVFELFRRVHGCVLSKIERKRKM